MDDGRGVDHGSPAELLRARRLSRPARPMSDQRHFVALLYTLSRDTTRHETTPQFAEALGSPMSCASKAYKTSQQKPHDIATFSLYPDWGILGKSPKLLLCQHGTVCRKSVS